MPISTHKKYLMEQSMVQNQSFNIMAATEPLNGDGSPPHREAQTVKLEMEDKMVQIKKVKLIHKVKLS